MTLYSINPYSEEALGSFETMPKGRILKLISSCHERFLDWQSVSMDERCRFIKRLASILRDDVDEFAQLITKEMGKPIKESRAEIEKCAWLCDYYAECAPELLRDEVIKTDAKKSYVAFEPLGVILGIMPWNFPFWQVFRFAVPAICVGNSTLLKHAPNVSLCALRIENIFKEAGFPIDLFTTILVEVDQIREIIEHPLVRGVSLTGSVAAGRAVAQQAASQLKKSVLELGGSDPYIVLEDADIELAAEICVKSRTLNSGQSCIAAKRLIVVEPKKEEFIKLVCSAMALRQIGDPQCESNDIGPLARRDLRANLHRQVEQSIEMGATCLLGGQLLSGKGFFYPPTVLVDIAPQQPAYCEELFGPVAVIVSARDLKDAIRIANDTRFGLGAAVFTKDHSLGHKIALKELKAGSCFVNDMVRSDPRLPFGGIKDSGYGRELSRFGLLEFTNIKTIYLGA